MSLLPDLEHATFHKFKTPKIFKITFVDDILYFDEAAIEVDSFVKVFGFYSLVNYEYCLLEVSLSLSQKGIVSTEHYFFLK
jgi:hypothetical protein